jgi:hypothetical protein
MQQLMARVRVRVRKQDTKAGTKVESKADAWIQPDPLETCLECWKIYLHADADRDLGMKTMRGLLGEADAYGVDPSEAQQARDLRLGAATDACIDSLKRIHMWAIYRMCSIASPWNYPNADMLVVGPEAKAELTRKLKINVATGILF